MGYHLRNKSIYVSLLYNIAVKNRRRDLKKTSEYRAASLGSAMK